MEGYEQLCRVSGTAAGRPVNGLGQRGHSWGNPDWEQIALTRTVGAWFEDGRRGARARAARQGRPSTPTRRTGARARPSGAVAVDEVRLSTTTTTTAASSAPGSSCGSGRTTSTRTAAPARCCAARRSSSARCGWTSRSSAGTSRAGGRRPLRHHPARVIKAVISDFGGVITLPLMRRSRGRTRRSASR